MTKLLLLSVITALSLSAATGLTYNYPELPYVCPNTSLYVVWYGTWTDSTSQSLIVDFLNNFNRTPQLSIVNMLPVGSQKQTTISASVSVAAQLNVAYSPTYGAGNTLNVFTGALQLISDQVTAGNLPASPPTCYSNNGVSGYVLIFVGPGISLSGSVTGSTCAITPVYSLGFPNPPYALSIIGDQSGPNTCSPLLPAGTKVSGTNLADLNIFAVNGEMDHAIPGTVSWSVPGQPVGHRSFMEYCIGTLGTTFTSPVCTGGSSVCQYNTSFPGNDSVERYYLLETLYANFPLGSTSASCVTNYVPPIPGLWFIGKLE